MSLSAEWNDSWSSWVKEGHFVSYAVDTIRYYEHVIARDMAHYVYDWPEIIASEAYSTPPSPIYLELTKGYDKYTGFNQIWQMIFGISKQVYVYIEMPTDLHRHGLPKIPKPSSSSTWEVSHFEEFMSPFMEPSFMTEHFFIRPPTDRILFEAYNPQEVPLTPRLNIWIAKLQTERIGEEEQNKAPRPRTQRWAETIDKLYRRVIPHRPITIGPVSAPAEASVSE